MTKLFFLFLNLSLFIFFSCESSNNNNDVDSMIVDANEVLDIDNIIKNADIDNLNVDIKTVDTATIDKDYSSDIDHITIDFSETPDITVLDIDKYIVQDSHIPVADNESIKDDDFIATDGNIADDTDIGGFVEKAVLSFPESCGMVESPNTTISFTVTDKSSIDHFLIVVNETTGCNIDPPKDNIVYTNIEPVTLSAEHTISGLESDSWYKYTIRSVAIDGFNSNEKSGWFKTYPLLGVTTQK